MTPSSLVALRLPWQARLRNRGVYARHELIRRCLRTVDPHGTRERAKETQKTRYRYCVPGPRSLYHADAHEKLAKIWALWLHLVLDGYSRKILSLRAEPNKHATVVGRHFVGACNRWGWSSRVRWDKGSENAVAIEEQLMRMGTGRGSALTGRSVMNMRAEYIWVPVKRHISGPFRVVFFGMMRRGILDPSDPHDLHALHAVFLPLLQTACDEFVDMWNNHRIRGAPTERGCGGGIPNELWLHPVDERAHRDDLEHGAGSRAPHASSPALDPSASEAPFDELGADEYGVDEPLTSEAPELTFSEQHTTDLLEPWPVLQALRADYLTSPACPAGEGDDADTGVGQYEAYRHVTYELAAGANMLASNDAFIIDWATFHDSTSPYPFSNTHNVRRELSCIAHAFFHQNPP